MTVDVAIIEVQIVSRGLHNLLRILAKSVHDGMKNSGQPSSFDASPCEKYPIPWLRSESPAAQLISMGNVTHEVHMTSVFRLTAFFRRFTLKNAAGTAPGFTLNFRTRDVQIGI